MSIPPEYQLEPVAADEPPARPQTVTYALYAILAQCVFAVLFSIALLSARSYIISGWRTDGRHVGWSDQRLHDAVPGAVRANLISSVVVVLLVLLIASFIRKGRNWSRWLYAVLVIVPLSPLSELTRLLLGIVGDAPFVLRVPAVLAGLSALSAVVLLFLKPSRPFFKAVGASRVSIRDALFPSRDKLLDKYAAGGGKGGKAGPGASGADGAPKVVGRPRAKSRKGLE